MNVILNIEKLAKIFKKENYFFSKTKDGQIMLRFEDESGGFFEFRDATMIGAVKEAENYAKNEISIETPEEEVQVEEEVKVENDENTNPNQMELPL
jgi:hypothetical protein